MKAKKCKLCDTLISINKSKSKFCHECLSKIMELAISELIEDDFELAYEFYLDAVEEEKEKSEFELKVAEVASWFDKIKLGQDPGDKYIASIDTAIDSNGTTEYNVVLREEGVKMGYHPPSLFVGDRFAFA